MPSREQIALNSSEVLANHSPAANTAATATVAAVANKRHKVDALLITVNGDPATALAAEFRVNNAAVFTIRLPAAAFAPIYIPLGRNGLVAPVNQEVELNVPDPGAGISVTATILGQTLDANA